MIPPNAKVQRHAKQQQVPLNFSCRQAARCAAAQLPGGCQLYTGVALGTLRVGTGEMDSQPKILRVNSE